MEILNAFISFSAYLAFMLFWQASSSTLAFVYKAQAPLTINYNRRYFFFYVIFYKKDFSSL